MTPARKKMMEAFLKVSRQTSPKETTDAQKQIYRESDRYDVEDPSIKGSDLHS